MICMKIKTELRPADAAGIARGAELLRQGELVALPTETVYGIAADARNGEAVKKIFVAKGRPQDNPLIVHIAGPDMLPGLVSEVPERAQLLMAAFCPGPLTIIMPRGPEVAAECCAGLDTVGIRMPSHPVVQAIIRQSGCAFAAPSANLSGKPSPTNAQDVFTDMDGRLPLILDGGECAVGVESTVISVVGEKPTLFRPGHITLEELERALGEEVEVSKAILEKLPEGAVVRSPGMKYKHYAPKADVPCWRAALSSSRRMWTPTPTRTPAASALPARPKSWECPAWNMAARAMVPTRPSTSSGACAHWMSREIPWSMPAAPRKTASPWLFTTA